MMDVNDVRKGLIKSAMDALHKSYDPFEMVVLETKHPTIEMTPVLDENNFASRNEIKVRVSVVARLRHKTREEQLEDRKNTDAIKADDKEQDRKKHQFHVRLTELINELGLESESNTPDYLLSDYLLNCLEAFERATAKRAEWHGEAMG